MSLLLETEWQGLTRFPTATFDCEISFYRRPAGPSSVPGKWTFCFSELLRIFVCGISFKGYRYRYQLPSDFLFLSSAYASSPQPKWGVKGRQLKASRGIEPRKFSLHTQALALLFIREKESSCGGPWQARR